MVAIMETKKDIAIIGSGISGLTCAWLLSRNHKVTIFEANDYVGGHTATKDITLNHQSYSVDTGFIVFNDWTYPNFIKLLQQLDVARQATEMSFSVKCQNTGLEYSGNSLNTLFAQRSNLLKPGYWLFLRDILRFNKQAVQDLEQGRISPAETLGEYLQKNRYSDAFIHHYLVPMGSAIWSAPEVSMLNFPLAFFVRFFKNHGLLSVSNRPQWYVIKGGSREYVDKMLERLQANIYLSTPVHSVKRHSSGATVTTHRGDENFDAVIFACHSDQALDMLDDASSDEQEILGALPYQVNDVVLHTDASLLPQRKLAWASWNYHLGRNPEQPAALTYNMNILQGIDSPETLCVTLNNTDLINPKKILGRYRYSHPCFTLEGMQAQQQWRRINGSNHSWYCGAYWLNGFHEDGVNSALRVCEDFGETL